MQPDQSTNRHSPPSIVVHGPPPGTPQDIMNSRPASIRRRLDLLTDNELATISATIAAQEVAMQQRQVQMMNEALAGLL